MKTGNSVANRVLVTDDEDDSRWALTTLLKREGFDPIVAQDGKSALKIMREEDLDAAVVDMRMPGISGLNVLEQARRSALKTPIILITAFAEISTALKAVENGVFAFLTKPFKNDALVLTVHMAVESHRLNGTGKTAHLQSPAPRELSLLEAMGSSGAIHQIIDDVERVAPTDFTVIVTGETGVGKELVARSIHQSSGRAAAPFIPVDCGSLPPSLIESELFGHERGSFTGADRTRTGCFEAAAGGTLFLDEITNLPLDMQAKLLRALQERRIFRVGGAVPIELDVRVLAASNESLEALVTSGRFRRDLYHRLNEFAIDIPRLHDRNDDLVYLAQRFLKSTCQELGKTVEIEPAALDCLRSYAWPGNVRELRNVIRRAVLLADTIISVVHLRLEASGPTIDLGDKPGTDLAGTDPQYAGLSLREVVRNCVRQTERDVLMQVLKHTGGNKAKAARILRIDYKTIRTKAKRYAIPF
jgi:DNA-binding NtrC family response regulator